MSAKNAVHDTKNNNINWNDYLKSGDRIFIGSHAAVPNALIDNLIANSNKLHDIEAVHILTLSENVWAKPEHKGFI